MATSFIRWALFVVCILAAEVVCDNRVIGPIIGVDLGTTHACMGIYKNGRVEIIPDDGGNRVTPTYVSFANNNELVGHTAMRQAVVNSGQTAFGVKQIIGRRFNDSDVQRGMGLAPLNIVNQGGMAAINISTPGGHKVLLPEEVSSMVLAKMKDAAENYLGKEVRHAVITVPAHFDDAQRLATKVAGTMSGLEVLRIINEPTAAAIAYGLDKKSETYILVYHLGGSTLEVALLAIDNGVFEIVAASRDAHLGGNAFDQRVMAHLVQRFTQKHNKDMSSSNRSLQKLHREVQKAKRELSYRPDVQIDVEELFDGIDFSDSLTRARFEMLNRDLLKSTLRPIEQVLHESGLKKTDVHEIVLAGGSARIPFIQQQIKHFFHGLEPNRGINPDEAAAYGAAIQAGILSGEGGQDLLLLDVGFEVGGAMDIGSFRKNINEGFLPLPSDVTHEGLFAEYYFDTGNHTSCRDIFCPKYSLASMEDPLAVDLASEAYLVLGLDSGIHTFERPSLDLALVVDISGSMSEALDAYYYDGQCASHCDRRSPVSKMELAKESLQAVLRQLKPEDRFSIILFDDRSTVLLPLQKVYEVNMTDVHRLVQGIYTQGGTDLSAGIDEATAMLKSMPRDSAQDRETRMLIMTDAQPNHGDISGNSLRSRLVSNADQGIHTTFFGIGLDFNSNLVEMFSAVRGANYLTVASAAEFKKRMVDEFDLLVTPLVFNLTLEVLGDQPLIHSVFGVPGGSTKLGSDGQVLNVTTLFPSQKEEGAVKGGVILAKLQGQPAELDVVVRYTDREGTAHESRAHLEPDWRQQCSLGVRKAVLLQRFVSLLQNWLLDAQEPQEAPRVHEGKGIPVASIASSPVRQESWERNSKSLRVSAHYGRIFAAFAKHFCREAAALSDTMLQEEVELLGNLTKAGGEQMPMECEPQYVLVKPAK